MILQSVSWAIVGPTVSFFQHGNRNFKDNIFFVSEHSIGGADVMYLLRREHMTFAWVNAVALEALGDYDCRGVHALPVFRAAAFRTKGSTTLFENKSTTTSQVFSDGAGKPAWYANLIRFFLSMFWTINVLSPNSSILSTIFTALKKRFCLLYGFGSVSKWNLFSSFGRPQKRSLLG
jgi:hypothetical protein